MFQPKTGVPLDELRVRFGYRVILGGFALIALTVIVAAVVWNGRMSADSLKFEDVVSIVTAVTGIVGTIVGAFFAVNTSAAARDQMNDARQDAQNVSNRALAKLPPDQADSVVS